MKKNTLIQILFVAMISFQLIFYHLPKEIMFPLFLLSTLLIILLWIQKNSLTIPKTFAILCSFYLLSNLHSAFYSPYKFQATLEIIKLVGIFSLVILGANIFRNKKLFFNMSFILFLIASFWALCGILEFTNRIRTEKFLPLLEPFHWPTLAADFFLLIFPLALVFFLKERRGKVRKMVLFVGVFLISVAWILSQTHLIVFLFVATTILLLFFYSNPKQFRGRQIAKDKIRDIFLLILLIAVTLPNFFPSFGAKPISKEITSFQDKIFFQNKNDNWRFSINSIKSQFWRGIGPGNFGLVYRQNITQPWTWSDFASNELLQTFVEIGILGFVTQFLIFLYLGFICLKQARASLKSKRPFFFAISLSTILFLLINLNNFSIRIFPIMVVAFILVASLLVSEKTIKLKTKPALFLILPIIFIAFWIFSDSILLRIGQKFLVKKNYSKSERVLAWLSQRPAYFLNPRTLVWLSALQLDNNRPQEALEYLEKTKVINPYNQEIDYQIAAIIYRQGGIEKAKEILEKKVKQNSFLPPKYYLSLAKLNLETNNPQTATHWLKRASNLLPVSFESKNPSSTLRLHILADNNYLSPLWDIYFFLYRLTQNNQYLDDLTNLIY